VEVAVVTADIDTVHDTLQDLLGTLNLEMVDLEVNGGLVRLTVDREGGIDLEALAEANRAASRVLDELDPLPGRYTLEVSSPGVERRLRTPAQFARALNEVVTLRTHGGTDTPRRLQGTLVSADADGFVLSGSDIPSGTVRLGYGDVERARTVFEWGPSPKPSGARSANKAKQGQRAANSSKTQAAGHDEQTERVTTP
jgi:ribosome maturation factor RimP